MKKKITAVVICRCQPPHLGHIHLFNQALKKADELIIVLGSHRSAPNVRNPWTVDERSTMIECALKGDGATKTRFVAVRDHYYSDTNWCTEVHQKVNRSNINKNEIVLFGHKKDSTSYYLDLFPQWKFIDVGLLDKDLCATKIRDAYFSGEVLKDYLSPEVVKLLEEFRLTERYKDLCDSYEYLVKYKKSWENSPFPPIFMTVDNVVIKSGHILLVKRKLNPGKGLYALPGGFVNQDEKLITSAIRELKEETKIKINKTELERYVQKSHIFDNPLRSLRGRTITNAYLIRLPDGGELPEVKGADDAESAEWIPLGDLGMMEDKFFEDHLQIINFFTNQ